MFEKDLDITQAMNAAPASSGDDATAPGVASTPVDLARFGLNEIAYITQTVVDNVPMWSIHSAAGDPIGAAYTFDQAWAAVRQHDMEPHRVH